MFRAILVAAMLAIGTAPLIAVTKEDIIAAHERGDFATAVRLYQMMAEQGDVWAQENLGTIYENGYLIPQDYSEAAKWYHRAAVQGSPRAELLLGGMYATGRGVAQDDAEAARWYRRAAEQGLAVAQKRLGAMYGDGRGVPQDYVLAHMWFNLAAAQGLNSAKELRDWIAASMTREQIAEAQQMAREWLANR